MNKSSLSAGVESVEKKNTMITAVYHIGENLSKSSSQNYQFSPFYFFVPRKTCATNGNEK